MNSEKRFILAVGISFLILIFYPVYLKFISPTPINPPAITQSTLPAASSPAQIQTAETVASARVEAPKAIVAGNRYEFSNNHYDIIFSDRGATVQSFVLKNWDNKGAADVTLVGEETNFGPGAFLVTLPGQGIYFEGEKFSLDSLSEQTGEVKFSTEVADRWKLTKRFIFDPHETFATLEITAENLSDRPQATAIEIYNNVEIISDDRYAEQQSQAYTLIADKLEAKNAGKLAKKPFVVEGKIEWQALNKKYFTIIVAPDEDADFVKAWAPEKNAPSINGLVRLPKTEVAPGASIKRSVLIYAGPQYHKNLKSYDRGFEKTLSSGFFGIFKLWLLIALRKTYSVVGNYGWAILIVTCFIKLLFTPLTHISFESMRKMQSLQPKIKVLQDKHKSDQSKLSQETMALYKKHKVNPLGGCLPMLLQIPVFIAFYQVLMQTVELSGQPFIFWINDLSAPDAAFTLPMALPLLGDKLNILPIIAVLTTVWQQRLTPQTGPPEQRRMMMFMPVIFGFIFYKFPAGFNLYFLTSNLLSIAQQLFIKGKALPHHAEA